MRPIDFEGANAIYEKPKSMTDEECFPVSAYQHVDEKGNVVQINTVWQPSKEDIEAINAGRPIIVSICGSGLPPMSLLTTDENGSFNEEGL